MSEMDQSKHKMRRVTGKVVKDSFGSDSDFPRDESEFEDVIIHKLNEDINKYFKSSSGMKCQNTSKIASKKGLSIMDDIPQSQQIIQKIESQKRQVIQNISVPSSNADVIADEF